MARAGVNWRLVVGGVLCLALLVLAVFGPYLAPYPEEYSEKLVYRQTTEGLVAVYAPVPPSHAVMVRRKTEDLRNSMWVEAAEALGASRGRIGRRHLLPMLKEDLLLLLVNKVVLTLCLVGRLNLFGHRHKSHSFLLITDVESTPPAAAPAADPGCRASARIPPGPCRRNER